MTPVAHITSGWLGYVITRLQALYRFALIVRLERKGAVRNGQPLETRFAPLKLFPEILEPVVDFSGSNVSST